MYHDFSGCSTEGMSCVIGMSDGHRNQAVDATRMQPGDHPRDTGSPIVPDDVCALELNCIQDRDDVLDERGDPVGVDVLWLVRRAEAAQVRRDDAEPWPPPTLGSGYATRTTSRETHGEAEPAGPAPRHAPLAPRRPSSQHAPRRPASHSSQVARPPIRANRDVLPTTTSCASSSTANAVARVGAIDADLYPVDGAGMKSAGPQAESVSLLDAEIERGLRERRSPIPARRRSSFVGCSVLVPRSVLVVSTSTRCRNASWSGCTPAF